MRTGIVVSDIPMDQVGTLLSSSIEAGINTIDRISYLSSKYDESYQEALKKAVETSKVKAEQWPLQAENLLAKSQMYRKSVLTMRTAILLITLTQPQLPLRPVPKH